MRSDQRAACLSSCSASRSRMSRRFGSVSRSASSLYVCAASTSRRHIFSPVARLAWSMAMALSDQSFERDDGENAGGDEHYLANGVGVDLPAMQVGNQIRHRDIQEAG